jgi:hypothetical protein
MTHLQKQIHKTISWRGEHKRPGLLLTVLTYRSCLEMDYLVARYKDQ